MALMDVTQTKRWSTSIGAFTLSLEMTYNNKTN